MRIAICEDNKHDAGRLDALIKSYFADKNGVQVNQYQSGEALLTALEKNSSFDIIFLDIHLPDKNGVDIAKNIRSHDEITPIIFLTVTPEYARDGYNVRAFNYLLKPLDGLELQKTLDAIVRERMLHERCLSFISDNIYAKIPVSTIKYIQKQGRKTGLHLHDGSTMYTDLTMRAILSELDDLHWLCQSHLTCIVNMQYIRYVDTSTKTIVLKTNENGVLYRNGRIRYHYVLSGTSAPIAAPIMLRHRVFPFLFLL